MAVSDGSSTVAIAHMLPPRPWVVNQDKLKRWALSNVAAAGHDDRTCLLWLTGVQGVGTSAMAIELAYMLMEHCPDGQFFYPLRGLTADGPAEPDEAVTAFLRHSGTPGDPLPESPWDRQMGFRSRFFDRRILVVLDDAPDLATVKHLLPTSRKAIVIVTSMARMTGVKIARFNEWNVTALEHPFCTQLLNRYLGVERVANERDAADELISTCGRLPLSVELLCAGIADQPQLPLADVAAALRTDPARYFDDSPLLVPFGFVLRSIDRDDARAYLTLSLHRGPVVRDRVAAAMLDRTVDEARGVLAALTKANLLEHTSDGGYRFHAFAARYVRDRAGEEMPEADQSAALERLVICRLEWVVGLALTLWPKRPWTGEVFTKTRPAYAGKDARRAAAMEFEAEQPNFRASFEVAIELGLAAPCVYLALALKQWYYETGQSAVLVPMMERAAEAAGQLDDRPLHILMLNELGTAYESCGRFVDALAAFHRSEVLAREDDDAVGLASALSWKGIVELQLGNRARAVELLLAARDVTQSAAYDPAGRPRMLALLHMHLARAFHSMDQNAHAVREAEAALIYFTEHKEKEGANVLRSALTFNDALVALGRVHEATVRLRDAMSAIDDARLRVQRIEAWRSMARNHRALGELAPALTCLKQARGLARDPDLVTTELAILVALAELHGEMGDAPAATELLRKVRDMAAALGAIADRVAILRSSAACYRDLGDDSAARLCDDAATAVAQQINEDTQP